MALETFTWNFDLGVERTCKPKVSIAKFGDGYEQRIASGINNTPVTWRGSFTKGQSDADAIFAFLKARAGSEAFVWTDPMNVTSKYICREWSMKSLAFGVHEISATFEETFGSY